jgi:hypothetical protein
VKSYCWNGGKEALASTAVFYVSDGSNVWKFSFQYKSVVMKNSVNETIGVMVLTVNTESKQPPVVDIWWGPKALSTMPPQIQKNIPKMRVIAPGPMSTFPVA